MPTREEMRSLAGEIVSSYADRVAGIAELRETVKMDLKGFQGSRTAMAKELRADLAKSVSDMKSAVSTQLKEMDAAHATMSRELKTDLAKVRPALAEEDRKRQAEAREFIGELCQAVAEGKAAVKTLLGEFDNAHNAMSQELKADLGKICPALKEEDRKRQSEAREFMGELGRVVAEGKAATRALLRNFSEVQAGARDEWQILSAIMQEKRGGPILKVEPPAEETAEITPEIGDIRDQAFEYLANHPDGTRLVEMEQEFGLARIKIARVLRNLIDENKVEKRDMLYFAI